MTPAIARRRAKRWHIAAAVLTVIGASLAVVGIDLLTLPMFFGFVLCVGNAQYCIGWAHGREETK